MLKWQSSIFHVIPRYIGLFIALEGAGLATPREGGSGCAHCHIMPTKLASLDSPTIIGFTSLTSNSLRNPFAFFITRWHTSTFDRPLPAIIRCACSPHAANPVLTQLCGFQVEQCGDLVFAISTTPPTTPPYSLIVYTDQYPSIPAAFPLTVDNQVIHWTVVYPARQSRSFLPPSVHRSPC